MTSAPVRSRSTLNIVSVLLSQFLPMIVNFFATPYIVNKLGSEAYGVVLLISSLSVYLFFLEAALYSTSIRYFAEFVATQNWQAFRKFFWTTFLTYIGISSLASIIFIFFVPSLMHSWLNIPASLRSVSEVAFYITIASLLISAMQNMIIWVMMGYNEIYKSSFILSFVGISQPVLAVLLLSLNLGIIGIAWATLGASIGGLLLAYILIRQIRPPWGKPVWSWESTRILLSFGGWMAFTYVITQLAVPLPKIFLGKMVSTEAVAYFGLPLSITQRLLIPLGAFRSTLFPRLVEIVTIGTSTNTTISLVRRYLLTAQMLTTPLCLFFMVFSHDFLELWINPHFADQAALSMQIGAAYILIAGPSVFGQTILQVYNKTNLLFISILFSVLFYVPYLYFLTKYFGITGTLIAYISYIVFENYFVLGNVKKLLGLSPLSWITLLANRQFWVVSLFAGIAAAIRYILPWPPLLALTVIGGGFLLISGLYVWLTGFTKSERTELIRLIFRFYGAKR